MTLSDFEVPIDSLVEVTSFLPNLSGRENLLATLVADRGSFGVVLVDLLDKVRSVLVCNTESLTVHLELLVHINGFLGLFGINVALLSFTVVLAFIEELGLVHKNLGHTLRVVLASNLQS